MKRSRFGAGGGVQAMGLMSVPCHDLLSLDDEHFVRHVTANERLRYAETLCLREPYLT